MMGDIVESLRGSKRTLWDHGEHCGIMRDVVESRRILWDHGGCFGIKECILGLRSALGDVGSRMMWWAHLRTL